MATLKIELPEKDKIFIEHMAKKKSLSLYELFEKYSIEELEDEFDAEVADDAYQEYLNDPVTYSLEELKRELLKEEQKD